MTARHVKDKLALHGIHVDEVTVRKGIYTARQGFFYTHGRTSFHLFSEVSTAMHPWFTMTTHGTEHKPFKGGDSVKNSSHFWVNFAAAN